jgi:hypothetical protein
MLSKNTKLQMYGTSIVLHCDVFWVCRQSQQFLFHIPLFTSLHVSASAGHTQVQYTQSFLKANTPGTDPFLGHTVHSFKLCYVIYCD